VLFNSAEAIEGLEWMARFYDPIGGRGAVTAWQATQGSTPATVPFVIGTQAMDIQNPSRIGHVKLNAPALDFGIAPPPHSPRAKEGRGYIRGGWGYGVPSGVRHPHESWLLTHWLSATKEAAGWFMQQQLRPSPMKEVNEDKYYVESLGQAWTQMLRGLERDIPFPITPVDAEIDAALDKMVSGVLAGQTPARDGVQGVAQEVQRLLDDFWARQGR
jgi:ABC-type glycerol-3-phosphate transport system substrate-binding protein